MSSIDLSVYRPAEIWELTQRRLAYPKAAFRDTIIYLLSAGAMKMSVKEIRFDPGLPDTIKTTCLQKGPTFDEFKARNYEIRLLKEFREPLKTANFFVGLQVKMLIYLSKLRFSLARPPRTSVFLEVPFITISKSFEKKGIDYVLLRTFILRYLDNHDPAVIRDEIRRYLAAKGLTHRNVFFRFTLTDEGKAVRAYAEKWLEKGTNAGRMIASGENPAADELQELFSVLGHHLILIDDFPFAKIHEIRGGEIFAGGREATFFDDSLQELPDLKTLKNLPGIDNAIWSTFKSPGNSADWEDLGFPKG